ncbi:acinetobactin non-ribosomal peptide synthetase subunit BasB [Acinetobacter pittii]|uniref:acinetobactin non-ribosomal peptide synthetase subunit BasB n=1 Tax=Acinetobacter pittii TaxID=48296 RepID=UPI0021CDA5E1|nr:acinetobactin non-ribosomal peptide synthetase subunit BasB [Acinetobacter pittii]MCU4399800.1 acinetobactin non-ribosomal peptide synthetase subunit BasB [Acinetobacter pittii]MCU4403530.1 acinetobactin non-ribosomal peptide synthetase subunit BasB [Acinetobacter pittii]MCU4462947.1 acinetobactin non-ribosomal peptide synthetase subunit BasB [Acinetobacter pittii]
MLQLQQPEQVNRRFNLWKVNQGLDIQLLIKAIQDIIKTTPDLNVRYTFSDEGDLYKYPFDDHSACLELKKSNTEQVFEQVATLKAQSWNAEFHPPFFTSLVETEQDYFLILALHPILDESYKKSDFIQAIKNRYQQYSTNNMPLVMTEIDISHHLDTSFAKAPQQPNQAYVSEIILEEFRNTLAEPEMSQHDDFFDFGGHSLLATRIIGNLLNKHGIEIQFNDFFKSPSAADLAQYAFVKSAKTEKSTLQSVDKAPLTLAQDFLWQAYSAFDFSPIYNLPFAVEFLEEINEDIFFQAFTDIVERHAGLRTIFNSANGQTYQQVVPTSELQQFKWFWNSAESHDATLASEASYKFDLTRELPLRIRLIRNAKGRQTLSFLVHHMVIDEWSLNTIMADLAHAYLARSNAQAPNWKTPAQSILDFSLLQQKQGINQDHLNYWTNLLTGATKGLSLPVSENELNAEKEKPPVQWLELKFAPEMYEKLLAFSRQHSSSIFVVLYTAIANALQQQGNLKDIVIGTSASGRTDPEFFDTVGYFTTMVAHRTQFSASDSFQSLLHNISTMINTSMAYADIPINHIQNALGMSADEGLLFDVFIHIHSNNALNGALKTPQGQDLPYRQILPERDESMFGLHFEIMENVIDGQHQLSMIITYQAHRFPTATVQSICEKIKATLAQI